jgi:hypothetical protein
MHHHPMDDSFGQPGIKKDKMAQQRPNQPFRWSGKCTEKITRKNHSWRLKKCLKKRLGKGDGDREPSAPMTARPPSQGRRPQDIFYWMHMIY